MYLIPYVDGEPLYLREPNPIRPVINLTIFLSSIVITDIYEILLSFCVYNSAVAPADSDDK